MPSSAAVRISSETTLPAHHAASDAVRRGHHFLLGALLATVVLWNVPYGWYVLYPFKLFATWIHESSHGLLMLILGASFQKMEIFRDTSGLAYPGNAVTDGAQAAISSAGYLGTSFFGALLLVFSRTQRGARTVLAFLGLVMLVSALVYVRNLFGGLAVGLFGAVLVACAFWGFAGLCAFLANFLATQSCINAVLDIRVLFGQKMYVNGSAHGSDAHSVASLLGGPHWLWAAIWLVWSFAWFYAALRYVRLRPERA
jgi:hypothetical protein